MVLNVYRVEIDCGDCGYRGEIFRLESSDGQQNQPGVKEFKEAYDVE